MRRTAVHPGEVLADELEEIGVSPTALARQLAVPANRISQIIQGKRAVTGDTALRLGHWFGMSPQFWLNLQSTYDLRIAENLSGAEVRKLPTRGKSAAPQAAGPVAIWDGKSKRTSAEHDSVHDEP